MQSMTGGGHWGGGMFISAWDMARFGYLFLNDGQWNGRELISRRWMDLARTPGRANPSYGYMNWFLNVPTAGGRGGGLRQMYAAAPPSAVAFRGNGENVIYIDWEHDLVAVLRWQSRSAAVIERLLGAID
jgi:CubicO group peptidase (beta-lactamase class C family)